MALFDFRLERQVRSGFGGCRFNKIGLEVPKEGVKVFKRLSQQKDRLKMYIKDLLQQISSDKKSLLTRSMPADTLFLLPEGATIEAILYKNAAPLRKARKIAEKLI